MSATAFPHSPEDFRAALNRRPPVCLLTIGKVGSKSIGYSLEKCFDGAIIHGHGINLTGECLPGQIGPNHRDPRFRAFWEYHQSGGPIDYISPVRESLSRNLSDFFYNFHSYSPSPTESFTFPQFASLFYSRFPHLKHTAFFDKYFMPFTGIDVYNQTAADRALVFRIEDGSTEQRVRDFLGLPDFKLETYNDNTSGVYQEFKRWLQPTEDYLEMIRGTKYYQHFYV